MTVNQKELAACIGVSSRRIRQLKEFGLFVQPDGVKGYILENCIQEYIEYRVNAETGRRTSVSKEQIQAEHEEVKRQISLLKLRKLRKEVHEAADVEFFLTDMLTRFRQRLDAMPEKLAIKISGETDINKLIEAIRTEVDQACEELSKYDPDEINNDSEGVPDEEDEEDEDEEM